MAQEFLWNVVIETEIRILERTLLAPHKEAAMVNAVRIAENLGGNYTNVISCEKKQYDTITN